MAAETALSGRLVLELADGPGVYCGKLLADMGAEVVKLEAQGGDPCRHYAPRWRDLPGSSNSLSWLYMNTSKKSISLDITSKTGQQTLRGLAGTADLIIETLPPGRLDQLGLSYASLREHNPALVLTSISGFGQTGPYRDYKSSDIVASAMGGAMTVIGEADEPPVKLAGSQAWVVASTLAACSSLIALRHSAQSGCGQHVDISAQEAMLAVTSICGVGKWLDDGIIPLRRGTGLFASVPSGTYPCRDGSVYIMVNRPLHWQALAAWVNEVTGNQEVLDPMFHGPSSARQPYRELLDIFIAELTREFSVQEFYRQAQKRHLAVTPLSTARSIANDKHLQQRRFFVDVAHGERTLRYPGPPYRFSKTPWRIAACAPEPGAHDHELQRLLQRDQAGPVQSAAPVAGPALAGLRVVEFSAGMAGPWIGRFMACCGADVIKVESGNYPDVSRLYVPPRDPESGIQPQLSPWFTDWNSGKRFVALDLKRTEACVLAKRLIAHSDVVIDNNSNGVLHKLGLGFDQLQKIKPELVLFSSTGFGNSGPDSSYISWGPNLETLSGLSHLSGPAHRECTMTQFAYPDPLAALHGLFAVLSALDYRRRSGRGQMINMSQTEVTVAAIGDVLLELFANRDEPRAQGNASPVHAPQGCYRCLGEDRWCVLSVASDSEWQHLCAALEKPEWLADRRFASNRLRLDHQLELDQLIGQWTVSRDPYAVMHSLQAAGVAAGVVQNTEDQYLRDPHLKQRGFFEEITHRKKGSVIAPGIPLGLTATPAKTRDAGRPTGSDNQAVFCGLLGLSMQEYQALVNAGVIEVPA